LLLHQKLFVEVAYLIISASGLPVLESPQVHWALPLYELLLFADTDITTLKTVGLHCLVMYRALSLISAPTSCRMAGKAWWARTIWRLLQTPGFHPPWY